MTNEELAIKIQRGQTEYYTELWKQCHKLLYLIAQRKLEKMSLPNFVGIDDIEQEMYFAFCKAVKEYDSQKKYKLNSYFKFHVWRAIENMMPNPKIIEVSYNEPISDKDGEENYEMIDFIEDESAQERFFDIDYDALNEAVRNILVTLPELQQKVIVMRFIKGISLKEAADQLGVTVSKVRATECKALRALRSPKIRRQLVDFV